MKFWLVKNTRILPLYASIIIVGVWLLFFFVGTLNELWITNDQKGYQLFTQKEYIQAAKIFDDIPYKGAALFKAAEFKKAKAIYLTQTSKEARYNLGNCEMMLGSYDKAIEAYTIALKIDPYFTWAQENKALAMARKKIKEVENDGEQGIGDMYDMAPDEVLYDNNQNKGQDDERTAEKDASSGNPNWLDRLQTSPQSFLKNKFSYQYQMKENTNAQ